MKKPVAYFMLFSLTLILPQISFSESTDELSEQFVREYEALKPPETSSVRTDYKFEQTALATFQTAKLLQLMYNQNQEIISKYDEMLQKYDKIIEQNKEIIKILSNLKTNEEKDQP